MSKQVKEQKHTCNQCHKEMKLKFTNNAGVRVCDNPECPNFGLLQASMELMAEKLKEKPQEKIMLNWLKNKTANKIRRDYQAGIITKKEAIKRLKPVIEVIENDRKIRPEPQLK